MSGREAIQEDRAFEDRAYNGEFAAWIVFVDDGGLIYLVDRLNGLDLLEHTGPAGA